MELTDASDGCLVFWRWVHFHWEECLALFTTEKLWKMLVFSKHIGWWWSDRGHQIWHQPQLHALNIPQDYHTFALFDLSNMTKKYPPWNEQQVYTWTVVAKGDGILPFWVNRPISKIVESLIYIYLYIDLLCMINYAMLIFNESTCKSSHIYRVIRNTIKTGCISIRNI